MGLGEEEAAAEMMAKIFVGEKTKGVGRRMRVAAELCRESGGGRREEEIEALMERAEFMVLEGVRVLVR